MPWEKIEKHCPQWPRIGIFTKLNFLATPPHNDMVDFNGIKTFLCYLKSKVYYLIPRKYSTFWRSILMRLHSPVDLTGNLNMIEKLVLGGTGTGDPPNPQPDALTSAPSSHLKMHPKSLAVGAPPQTPIDELTAFYTLFKWMEMRGKMNLPPISISWLQYCPLW